MAQGAPPVGTVVNGYRFDGGNHRDRANWTQVDVVDVSADYGPGARRYPNGALIRVGPRGGVEEIKPRGEAESPDIKEFQANAAARATLMDQGSNDYQAARSDGYEPTSWWNGAARSVEGVPILGVGLSNLMRSPVADRGRAAELQFVDGALRTTTGANAPEPEVVRADRSYFIAPGESEDVESGKAMLRDRFRNQAIRVAGHAYIPGESPAGGVGPADENGLPTYPSIDRILEQGASAAPPSPPPASPQGPGSGPDSPVDISGLSANDLMALQPGQYIRFPDGRVERLSGAPRVGAEGEEVSPGVFADQQDRVDDVAGVMFSPDQVFARSALEQVPLAREAMAGITSAFTGNSYQDTRAAQRALADVDREQQPLARNMGGVAGATALAATPFGAPLRVTRGASLAGRVVNRAAGGSVAGGAWGLGQGEGNAIERLPEAGAGAMFGAVAGPAAPVAANALGRVAAPVVRGVQAVNRFVGRQAVNALGDAAPTALREAVQPNALRSGMNRFADRSPQDANALNTEASRFRAEEIAPAFADVVNDGGRGTMRALATRQTPARQAAREFADGRAAGLQDRVSFQARRTISDDPRQPRQIRDEAMARAREDAAPLYEEAYARPGAPRSPLTDDLMQRPSMRDAMGRASRIAREEGRDPTTLGFQFDEAGDVIHVREPSMQTMDYVKRGLDDVLESYRDPVTGRLNLDTAGRAAQATREAFRRELRRLNPKYGEALDAYGEEAAFTGAVDIGERFLTMEADDFATAVARLTPDQQEITRAAARRAVERQAGTQGQAPGVAQRLSNGREQGARTTALVGDAEPVQRAMGAELQALRNAQGVSPAQGSPTSMNAQDAMGAAGATLDIATGGIAGLARKAITAIRSRGFNDAEAQAVVEAAIDPARTNELIGMLAERMSRREARNLARAIRYQLTTGPQSGQQR